MRSPTRPENSASPYQAAIESLLGELDDAQNEVRAKRVGLAIAETRVIKLVDTVLALVEMLPPHDRADIRHRVAAAIGPLGRASRGVTVTYSHVLDLLTSSPGKDWSAAEAHAELVGKGIPSDPEQVHNVFQYLSRKQRVERVSRGRYRVVETKVA